MPLRATPTGRGIRGVQTLRLQKRMYRNSSTTIITSIPCRSDRSSYPEHLHTPRQEAAAASDSPNSKHHPYAARYNRQPRTHLPLEIPTVLLRRTTLVGYIRGVIKATFSRAAHIDRYARGTEKNHRRRATSWHSDSLQRYVRRERVIYTF